MATPFPQTRLLTRAARMLFNRKSKFANRKSLAFDPFMKKILSPVPVGASGSSGGILGMRTSNRREKGS